MLKTQNPLLESAIQKIFNEVLTSGKYPELWNIGSITSIFKSGDIYDPNNFRGITITSSLGKLFNRILNKRLENYREINSQGCVEQNAYKKNCRTTDHMFVLKTIIDKYNKKNKPIYACFIDMKKAFDSVLHQAILYKLLKSGVKGQLYNIIKDMYENTRLAVKVGSDCRTEFFPSHIGIRQGDNLSPNLFKILLDDLPDNLNQTECNPIEINNRKLNCLLYADDIVLLSESPNGLQKAIDLTELYGSELGLEINIKKTKSMVFSKKGNISKHKFTIKMNNLEEVKTYL